LIANSVPSIYSYQSVALAYLPRPDGIALINSPDILAENGQYTKIPMIIGDQEDEGTLFSLNQYNISTTDQLVQYFKDFFFHDATLAQVQTLVSLYPDDPSAGSPFRTGPANNIYPEYKRLAAMLGDLSFILARRIFLALTSTVAPSVPSWSYLASYDYGTAVLGTFHASDIPPAYGLEPGVPSTSIQAYYLSFVNQLNPNLGTVGELYWPQWSQGNMLMNFNAASNVLIPDNFRQAAYDYIKAAGAALYI
jgi:carboxylesterase type B